ncbi:MAG: Clostripain family protein, partial [Alistipes sp.]|nr:Clostripain family protein [Alistipes sp.]
MKRLFPLLLIIIFGFSSCSEEPLPSPPKVVERTVFMYLPWSGNLINYFYENINDFEKAIAGGILGNERFVVYLCTSASEATLFEIVYKNGKTERQTLKSYTHETPVYTTAQGITSILNDVVQIAPAGKYGMTIGCHGMGWIPVGTAGRALAHGEGVKEFWEAEVPLTRWFGGTSSQYQPDITTLRDG